MEKLNNQSLEVTDPIKKEKYINICEGEPDAIFILAKTLVDGKHGERKIGGYNDVDIHNTMSGGHARNKAAVELYKYFHNSNKHNIQQNTANTYGFLKLYCQKKEKKELGDQVELLIPDFIRLFVNASYQFIKLDYIKSEKKKRFCCF